MRQEWIEFEGREGNKILLRPEYVSSLCNNWNNTGCVMVGYDEHMMINDEGRSSSFALVNEPYEQVKQKIMDVEKVDYSNVVAEHFTREEYELIENVMLHKVDQLAKDEPCTSNYYAHDRILIKLNEILKEDE